MAQNVRLSDIARSLGLSETTVSRALSGKGRVSEATRKKVRDYINATGYRPNMLARGLAQSRSYNICAILPPDAVSSRQGFFHGCLMGICAEVEPKGYNVIITTVPEGDRGRIERILSGGIADGCILMRGTVGDPLIKMLREREVPFVLIGRSDEPGVVCVDANNEDCCAALTKKVLAEGFQRPGLLLGDMGHLVNRSRKLGFEKGAESFGVSVCPQSRLNVLTEQSLREGIDLLLKLDCDVLFCGDDLLSARTLRYLRERGAGVPVVSFYGSTLLELGGSIHAAAPDNSHELGMKAAEVLLDILREHER